MLLKTENTAEEINEKWDEIGIRIVFRTKLKKIGG